MGLIAVMCVTGVISGEILGPLSHLRFDRRDDFGGDQSRRAAMRGELADDAFQFDDPFVLLALDPRLLTAPRSGSLWPTRDHSDPVFTAFAITQDDSPGDDTPPLNLVDYQSDATAIERDTLGDPVLSPPTQLADFTPFVSSSLVAFAPSPSPPASPTPEPATWLLLMLGVGSVGMALRRGGGPRILSDGRAIARLGD